MFQQYVQKYKQYLNSWAGLISGQSNSQNFDYIINTNSELNAIKNASSAEQLIHTSNAYYDQVATGRSIKELYKKPKDYLREYNTYIADQINSLDTFDKEVSSQILSIQDTIQRSKVNNNLSHRLLKKISLIKSEYDARH